MRRLITALVLAASAILSLACGQDHKATPPAATEPSATVSPTPSPAGPWAAPGGTPVAKPGWTAVRSVNVTVSVPEEIVAYPTGGGYTSLPARYQQQPVLIIEPRGVDGVRIIIDAETGVMVREAGTKQALAALQVALDTVRFSPFDPENAAWPYADTTPPERRGGWGDITYPQPDPLSGIGIGTAVGDGGPPGVCNMSISAGNWRSRMVISACTGEPFVNLTDIHPEDKDAFGRFLEAIEVKP